MTFARNLLIAVSFSIFGAQAALACGGEKGCDCGDECGCDKKEGGCDCGKDEK